MLHEKPTHLPSSFNKMRSLCMFTWIINQTFPSPDENLANPQGAASLVSMAL
jgi:hypothetical protein